jgi:hypothetical protein
MVSVVAGAVLGQCIVQVNMFVSIEVGLKRV